MTKFEQLLADIEQRPLMYIRDEEDIDALQLLFAGYAIALHLHGIEQDVGDFNRRFRDWLYARFGWNTSRGWAAALRENTSSEASLLSAFLLLARQFFARETPGSAVRKP